MRLSRVCVMLVAWLGANAAAAEPPRNPASESKVPPWRDFKNGRRIGRVCTYVGVPFVSEDCKSELGRTGRTNAKTQKQFGRCLAEVFGRTDEPWDLASAGMGPTSANLTVESSNEIGTLKLAFEEKRRLEGLSEGTVYYIAVYNRAEAERFLREHTPAITPEPAFLEAMAKSGGKRMEAIVDFCLGEDGRWTKANILKSSGYESFDNAAWNAAYSWRTPFQVDGVGVRICGKLVFVYPAQPAAGADSGPGSRLRQASEPRPRRSSRR